MTSITNNVIIFFDIIIIILWTVSLCYLLIVVKNTSSERMEKVRTEFTDFTIRFPKKYLRSPKEVMWFNCYHSIKNLILWLRLLDSHEIDSYPTFSILFEWPISTVTCRILADNFDRRYFLICCKINHPQFCLSQVRIRTRSRIKCTLS